MLEIKSCFKSSLYYVSPSFEILAVTVYFDDFSLRFILVYLPNSLDPNICKGFFHEIKTLINPDRRTIILGDFNLPEINWNTCSFPENQNYRYFYDFFLASQPLDQIITFSTRGNNILDLLLTNDLDLVTDICSLPPMGSSDHVMVKFSLQGVVLLVNRDHRKYVILIFRYFYVIIFFSILTGVNCILYLIVV